MDDYNDFFHKTMQLLLLEETKKTITKDGLNQLKSKKFNDSIKCEVCPITIENFNENDDILELPCNHIFKEKGILRWLKEEHNCCPVCRKEIQGEEKIELEKFLNLEKEALLNITNIRAFTS